MPDPTTLEWLEVARTASGAPLRIAVHTLEGAHDGPTVGLTAGIHGDEIVPIEVVRRVLAAIDPQKLHGRIVAVPLADPPGFESFTRHTPTDMHNLNRVFPGTADSWLSDLLARALVERLVPEIDVLIDLHSGGAIPTVDYVYVLNAPNLSRAFGFPTLYRGSSYPGSFGTHVIDERGIPVVVAEIGGGGQHDGAYLERGVDGVLNVLRRAGALEGDVIPAPEQLLLNEMRIVRPSHGGVHTPVVTADRLGETVAKGTVLGHVRDPQTFELLETFEAPFDPTHLVLVRGSLNRVHPGDYGYMLGNAATAERLPAES
jgi:predicted deacylase